MASNSTGINNQVRALTVQSGLKNSNEIQPQILDIYLT